MSSHLERTERMVGMLLDMIVIKDDIAAAAVEVQNKSSEVMDLTDDIPVVQTESWACPACTFVNGNVPACDMCTGPRPDRTSSSSSSSSSVTMDSKLRSSSIAPVLRFLHNSSFADMILAPPTGRQADTRTYEELSVCCVCDEPFSFNTPSSIMSQCQHGGICRDCFAAYASNKIQEKLHLPWIRCPMADCECWVDAMDLVNSDIPTQELWQMAVTHMAKSLLREREWHACCNDKCDYGIWIPLQSDSKKKKSSSQWNPFKRQKIQPKEFTCAVCNQTQPLEEPEKEDPELNQMMNDGVIRPCPKCNLSTFKEKGICNVLQCGSCDIWWNWRTRETGQSQAELKQRARMNRTLWEPGELQYQMNLQHKNPEEFKALLARNGVKHDPNYRRGGW